MNAVRNIKMPQLKLVKARPTPAAPLQDLVVPIRVIDLKDAQQLSRFVPIVVLIPHTAAQDISDLEQTTVSESLVGSSGILKLQELLGIKTMRGQTESVERDFTFGDARVSFSSMEVSRKGKPVTLRLLEFKILKYFAQNARRVISRNELLNEVWGYENYPSTRTVDNHIFQLRLKFEKNPSRPLHFQTVHGAGYKFLP